MKTSLGRTLGLGSAIAIGVGTMVGAGIFIFPGIAAGEAGPASVLSFLIGGVIALAIAMCTAELASAMPAVGGGYYFISRAIGPFPGALAGIGQWLGLIFAAAFYLSGFAEYLLKIAEEAGADFESPLVLVSIGAAVLLTGVNVVGTRGVGKLQNIIVITLALILSVLFFYGLLRSFGIGNEEAAKGLFTPFMPRGFQPVLTTTALIFTAYLGFAQIATVAGEIKRPQKNLPRSLIGSVVIVTIMYCLAVVVSTRTLPYEQLGQMRETAMVEVVRTFAGKYGALAVLVAGLLATLSSANASILSSSRSVFALGKDKFVPAKISRISDEFGTPHIAILLTGLLIAGISVYGKTEILAEVASFLHLIIYGGMSVTVFVLRIRKPAWYVPTYMVPGQYVIPVLGILSSIVLVVFMQKMSLIIGAGIMLVSAVWYFSYARGTKLSAPDPPHIDTSVISPRVVVPVKLPDPRPLPYPLLRAFEDLELTILGYHVVKEQTGPSQAREKYEDQSKEQVQQIVDQFDTPDEIDSQVLYTADFSEGLSEFLADEEFHLILTAQEISEVKRLLLPIYNKHQINTRMSTVVHQLASSCKLPVSVMIMSSGEKESEARGEQDLLADRVRNQLARSGLSYDDIRITKMDVSGIVEAVDKLHDDNDIVILSEADPKQRNLLVKNLHGKIRKQLDCPILVILNEERE